MILEALEIVHHCQFLMPSAVQQVRKLVFPQQLLQPGKQSGGGDALQSRLKVRHTRKLGDAALTVVGVAW